MLSAFLSSAFSNDTSAETVGPVKTKSLHRVGKQQFVREVKVTTTTLAVTFAKKLHYMPANRWNNRKIQKSEQYLNAVIQNSESTKCFKSAN